MADRLGACRPPSPSCRPGLLSPGYGMVSPPGGGESEEKTLEQRATSLATSAGGLHDQVEVCSTSIRYSGLAPTFDGEGDGDQ